MSLHTISTHLSDTLRCQKCRYWFDRCCHALAMLEESDKCPATCMHFVAQAIQPPQWLEAAS